MQSTNINAFTTLVINTNTALRALAMAKTHGGRENSNQCHHLSVKLEFFSMEASYMSSQKLFSRTDIYFAQSNQQSHHHFIHFLFTSTFNLSRIVFPLNQGTIIKMSIRVFQAQCYNEAIITF